MILNKTKRQILCDDTIIAKTRWQQLKGLLFRKSFKYTGLIFEFNKMQNVTIHTYFMRFPIDIIFLDADQYVKEKWLDSYVEMTKEFDIIGVEAWEMRPSDFYPYKRVKDKEENYSYVGGGGMMMKSNLFEKLGKFDEDYDFIYFEDPSLCFLAREKGYKVGWNNDPIIIHDHSGPLMLKKNKQYFIKNWKTFQKKWRK